MNQTIIPLYATLFFVVFFWPIMAVSEDTTSSSKICQTEEDIDSDSCNLSDLPIPGLEAICNRVGLNMETYMFPEMDEERVELGQTLDEVRSKDDYVEAATQCLLIEEEVERMLLEDPDSLDALEQELLDEDPDELTEAVTHVLSEDPDLMKMLEEEIKRDDPGLYKILVEELNEGESLVDRPDLLADIFAAMLDEDFSSTNNFNEETELKVSDDASVGKNTSNAAFVGIEKSDAAFVGNVKGSLDEL